MKICICDDDISQCESLKAMILAHDENHKIISFHSAEEMLFECEEQFPFDCVFLDIQMKKMNGIECAKKIRSIDKNVVIVFLSAIRDYVFEGYEVNAMRYLLKPLDQKKCHELLDLIESSIQKEKAYLYVNKMKICCDDILYIESCGHYCSIYASEVIEVKMSLNELYSNLSKSFIQTHRSYIVNLDHVDAVIADHCLLENQAMIPISRSSQKKVNEAFMEYIKGGLL